jgi:C_GCAxxG_C_C family probable redox protein
MIQSEGREIMVETISIPQEPDWARRVREKAERNVVQHEACAQSVLAAFMDELGFDEPLVFRAAGAMQGGMLCSLTCGVHTAGMMVLGLLMGRERLEEGLDGIFPITGPAQELIGRLNRRLGSSSCRELSGVDFTDMNQAMAFMSSGESHKCYTLVADGAEEIALFLQDMAKKGELFRVSKAR